MEAVAPDIAWDLRTANVELVRSKVSTLLRPFKLRADPRRSYDARLFGRQLSSTGIAIIDYGQEVDVEADPMQSFSLLQIPIRGSFELHGMGKSALVSSSQAHLIGPATPLRMHWSPDCRLLVLRLDGWVTRRLVADCRSSVPAICSQGDLGAIVPIDKGPGLSLFRTLCLLRDEALTNGSISNQRGFTDCIENLLVRLLTHVLLGHIPPSPETREPLAATGLVKQAKAFMLANLARGISTADIATACGVSSRTLFRSFHREFHTAPRSWLTERRLDAAREALCGSAAAGGSVTEIALNCGFNHLGRFSASYRRRFGESPSQTLKRKARS